MLISTRQLAGQHTVNSENSPIVGVLVPGKCVKRSSGVSKYGVPNPFEVHLAFPPKVALSKTAWQLKFPYQFMSWQALNQAEDGDFVDLS